MKESELLAWIDIETTGIDVWRDSLLEVALIITTQDLIVLEKQNWVLFFDKTNKDIVPIVDDMHRESGLWVDCVAFGIPLNDFEKSITKVLADVLRKHPQYTKYVMAGSGVARFDYTWFQIRMPSVLELFSYYTFDTGVIRRGLELAGVFQIRADSERDTGRPKMAHRAMTDIEDHLEEWRWYGELLKYSNDLHNPLDDWVPNAWRNPEFFNPELFD